MRIGKDGYFHLSYCTNIHPGERWEEVFRNLKQYLPTLKKRLSPSWPFGVGLRLSNAAANDLLKRDALPRFKGWLEDHGLYVYTINGFPYGSFHGQVVKDNVYVPDWRSAERVDYTLRLAHILAELLPADMEGGISTSPISYKRWLNPQEQREALEHGAIHLALLTAALARLRDQTDRLIHVDLEPEPDCLVENLQETISFFCNGLIRRGGNVMVVDDLLEHIRVCYDTCHFAVEYENPSDVFWQLAENGIRIGKIQVSSALRVPLPQDTQRREKISGLIQPFAESTYLHQVVERTSDDSLRHYPDLPEALSNIMDNDAEEWRIHYHVPVFAAHFGGLESTQSDTAAALSAAQGIRSCPHLEIETYTWDVLPPELNLNLMDSLQREYEWVLGQFGEEVSSARSEATAV